MSYFRKILQERIEKEKAELHYLRGSIDVSSSKAPTSSTSNTSFGIIGEGVKDPHTHSSVAERNHVMQLISRKVKLINHLENALIRIENKTYGICKLTGKLIDKDRLKLVPHATLSREAKEEIRNNGNQ